MKLKMRVTAVALAAAAAITAGGCGSSNEATTAAPTSSASSAAAAAPQFISKRVGESGGWACPPDKPNDQCSIRFTVTSLTRVGPATCASHSSSIPNPGTVYRVTMEVVGQHPTPPPNGHIQPGYVVTSQNWYVLGPDGYTSKVETAIGCGSYTPGAFYDYTAVGEKARGEILFAVPEGSSKLRLKTDSGGGWEWDLPR